jgi:cellobiose PTS system EIIA component
MNEMEEKIMKLIIYAGEAKNHAYEALQKVNVEDYEGADAEMKQADDALNIAHNVQTSMLQKEACGEKMELSVLFVHAQDHLMTAISEKSLIEQIIDLRKVVNTLLRK